MPHQSVTTQKIIPTALVTGAGTGIGLATVEKFLSEGWNVAVLGRRSAPLEALRVKHGADRILPLPYDITNSQAMTTFGEQILSDKLFGRGLTVLVNNAGIFERRTFKETSDALWEDMFATHLLGSVRVTRAVLPLLELNKGAIINVSSTLGLRPIASTSAYSALKAAMINWTECLAIECAQTSVRVNCVCPGIIDTPIHAFHTQSQEQKASLGNLQPLGRLGRPDDVAYAIWSLSAPGSEWITGTTLKVDGGINLV